MMKLKKLFISIMCLALLGTSGALNIQAIAAETPVVSDELVSTEEIEPRADIIETYFRKTPWGTLQYRRWNSTRGYWVDPDWIDM